MEIRITKNGQHLRRVEGVFDTFRGTALIVVEVQESRRYKLLTAAQWNAAQAAGGGASSVLAPEETLPRRPVPQVTDGAG